MPSPHQIGPAVVAAPGEPSPLGDPATHRGRPATTDPVEALPPFSDSRGVLSRLLYGGPNVWPVSCGA